MTPCHILNNKNMITLENGTQVSISRLLTQVNRGELTLKQFKQILKG